MTGRGVRLARYALLGLFAAVAGGVLWTLRGPPEEAEAGAAEAPPAPPSEARMGELVIRSYVEGERDYEITASRMLGREQERVRLEDATVTFSYVSEGEPAEATVTGHECLYDAGRQEALFEGDVVVRTADGLELRTESLTYRLASGLALSDDPVAFRGEELRGTATGMAYHSRTGTVNLPADVRLQLATRGEGVIEIRSERAILHQDEGRAVFQDAVQVVRGDERLTSERLVVFGTREHAERIRATQDVLLTMGGDVSPGALPEHSGSGRRELRAHQLDAVFRPADGSLQEVVGSYGAELTLYPGPGEPPELRRLSGKVLTFRWDERRRLYEVQGQSGTEVRVEPLAGSDEPLRTLSARNFIVVFDRESGEMTLADFQRDVVLTRGGQVGRGGRGLYDTALGSFSLRDDPRLEDPEQGSELVAELIEFQERPAGLQARGQVRHTLRPSGEGEEGLLEEDGVPTVIRCEEFQLVRASGLATYAGSPALLRRGDDEVRAPVIRLSRPGGEARRLEAEGGVVTLLHPQREGGARPSAGEAGEAGDAARDAPAPMEGRAERLAYDESSRVVRYTGEVELRQGELLTRAPEAVVTLAPDSRRIERLEAGEPVQIVQGARRASGERATWFPAEEKVVIVGPEVVLEDVEQRVEGRSLTFNIADDTILVDGRDRRRTETVFR